MPKLMLVAALVLPLTAYSQPTRDANPRASQNTEGANAERAGALDPETKARVRTEGSTGGIEGGMRTEEQKEGGSASSGPGRPNRSASGLEGQGQGRVHNETSSEREEGRGARGAIR